MFEAVQVDRGGAPRVLRCHVGSPRESSRISDLAWVFASLALLVLLVLLAGCGSSGFPAPTIRAQPTDTAAAAGTSATLSVSASGVDVAYQWQQTTDAASTWTDLPGATSARYATPLLTTADASSVTMNGERNRAILGNGAGAGGVPTPAWQWHLSLDGGAPWSNVNGATSGSFTTPATSATDTGRGFRAVATNASGSATTQSAQLNVTATVSGAWQSASGLSSPGPSFDTSVLRRRID